ncbi:DUF6460 domain-containing protein [Aestuariispira insulae]|uniref:DUF6460 domain-containing protein n=1 Tax=Aestuariispira insulae TaxID=1461337 RepID=A0A3D9H6F2_9PROT|nr:DUF6460 domain-containing protein [Aestuariispira insulae]RED45093.1 hypothetical protein DFP90_11286 [Aestuariispira insulae]
MSNSESNNRNVIGTVIKLLVASLVVGLLINWLEITPKDVFDNFGETIASIYRAGQKALNWASDYIVTGALIVLPIWGLVVLVNFIQNKTRRK